MKVLIYFLIVFSFFSLLVEKANARNISSRLSGQILLDVERNGEAWYVYPVNSRRYYLGRPNDAFSIMRELGLGISETNFEKIADIDSEDEGDIAFSRGLAGRIVLQVEKNGEAWYINPLNLRKYYLGRPDDAFSIMRELGLGISRRDLAHIHKNSLDESIDKYSSYSNRQKVEYDGQDFYLDVVEINLDNPNLKIITETANSSNCPGPCYSRELIDYVIDNDAFAAINGSYFDTSRARLNYYFFPVYNSRLNVFINEDQLRYPTTGPIMAFDQDNNFHYFRDSRDFKNLDYFESSRNTKLQAAIGNKPRLIENSQNFLIEWEMDHNQRYLRATRNALAYKRGEGSSKGSVFLVVARNVTLIELTAVLMEMEMDYALNLDGGYSTALYYNGEYMFGPGRRIPNAILFAEND